MEGELLAPDFPARTKPTLLKAGLAVLMIGVGGLNARAQAQAQSQPQVTAQTPSTDWQFNAILYGYVPWLTGSATFPTGRAVNVTVDPHDLISNLNLAFMGAFEARKGRWGAFTDIIYSSASGSKSDTREFSIGGVAIPASVTGNLHLDVKTTVWTTAGFYSAVDTPTFTLQPLLGARGLFLKQDLNWQFSGDVGPLAGPGRAGSGDSDFTNWDAIVGLKGRYTFGEQGGWYLPYYFDVGTGASHLTYQLLAGVGYQFHWGSVLVAWRYLDYQFKSNSSSLAMNGPAIGVGFRW